MDRDTALGLVLISAIIFAALTYFFGVTWWAMTVALTILVLGVIGTMDGETAGGLVVISLIVFGLLWYFIGTWWAVVGVLTIVILGMIGADSGEALSSPHHSLSPDEPNATDEQIIGESNMLYRIQWSLADASDFLDATQGKLGFSMAVVQGKPKVSEFQWKWDETDDGTEIVACIPADEQSAFEQAVRETAEEEGMYCLVERETDAGDLEYVFEV